ADLELANAIDTKYLKVCGGMRAGSVNTEQARVVVAALDALPADLDPEVLARAEAELVELAARFDPAELRRIGRKILEVVAPDVAEDEEAKALEREEQRARETCSFRFKAQGDGTTRITGLIPDGEANRLETYLNAYTSPRATTGSTGSTGPVTPRHRLLGQAFCALLEHLDPTKLPDHGGDATTVIVTIDHTQLLSTLGAADLLGGLDGSRISATEARRLACTAHILPAVLGGKGEVLDLGRARRLFSAAQRKALRIRDRHCRAEGCSIPAPWCEAHHLKPWSQGGNTDLADGILLCNHHHHRAHDTRYETQRLASGDLRFHRRN
ncbi:MAG: HNH endonuclease, partial [Nocardioidaceae bacterium]|nr:HNH endonuclease [Nocardioidaceae bacterium]